MNPSICRVHPSESSMMHTWSTKSPRMADHNESIPTGRHVTSLNVSNSSSPHRKALWSEHTLRRRITVHEEASQDQALNEYRHYVQTHFHKFECVKFVPKVKQPEYVTTVRDLRCMCGEVLTNHESFRNTTDIRNTNEAMNIVPPEFRRLVSKPDNPIPKKIPYMPWNKATCLVKDATDAYGKISFNMTVIGGMKPAKYVRLADNDSVDELIHCMVNYWRIMDPKPPSLVISVIGGAKNFKLDGKKRDTFHSGLIKLGSAWLITSGFNIGIMKTVGQVVHQGQTFTWDNDRMAHNLRCIGIAPWGYVENRQQLCSTDHQGSFPVVYKPSNCVKHNSPISINPDHTHFIFVDNGMRNTYSGVADFRAAFERKISQGTNEGGLGIPVVIIVVEGGVDAIRAVATSIKQGTPVVIGAGTGRAADILSYAYTHTVKARSGQRFMQKKHLDILSSKLFQAYGKSKHGTSSHEELDKIKELVLECCQKHDLITIFYMEKNEDLDLAILSALLKAQGSSSLEQRQSQLRLALKWNRCDIVQEEIFREDIFWPSGSLHGIMTDALLQDRLTFVQLLIQQGFSMKEYLTVKQLEELYNAIPQHSHLRQMLKSRDCTGKFTLPDIKGLLMNKLLDEFDEPEYNRLSDTHPKAEFSRPYRELFLWSVLLNRQNLAKFCWEIGEDIIDSALVATRLYKSLANEVDTHDHVLKQTYLDNKDEFESLAVSVLNECQSLHPDKAMLLIEKPSPSWSHVTGLQMAASAGDQAFLSASTCQNSVNITWKRGILSSWRKVLLALFCPILIWPMIEIEVDSSESIGFFHKAYRFYKAPITKFAANTVMYLVFLCTYSYMVLFDIKPYITLTEMICIIWIFTFLVDELHSILAFPSSTVKGRFRDWYGYLNRLDLLNLILVFIGFCLKLYPPYLVHAKAIYCLNCVSFFLRILKLYKANSFLGPKLYMIVRMIEELLLFVCILVVFLLAYGVSSQSLLWPNRSPHWGIIKDILYYPYWQIYGELFLEEIETDSTCHSLYDNSTVDSNVPCRTSSFLVPILLAAYLLIGNVLLLNLLIAIFSHVFDEVQKRTLEIWKYQVYFLVMEYEIKTSLVPPLSIIEHIYRLFKFILQRSCCHKPDLREMSNKQLQYLKVFEKEMMKNFLRRQKAEELDSIDYKFEKIQKRVDDMTKLIEDEIIYDHENLDWESAVLFSTDGGTEETNDVHGQHDQSQTRPSPEEGTEDHDSKEHHKGKKKKKHKRRHGDELHDGKDDLWYTSQDTKTRHPAQRPHRPLFVRRRLTPLNDEAHSFSPLFADEEMYQKVWSDEDIDLTDMVPITGESTL